MSHLNQYATKEIHDAYEKGKRHGAVNERSNIRSLLLAELDNRVRSPKLDEFVKNIIDAVLPEKG